MVWLLERSKYGMILILERCRITCRQSQIFDLINSDRCWRDVKMVWFCDSRGAEMVWFFDSRGAEMVWFCDWRDDGIV